MLAEWVGLWGDERYSSLYLEYTLVEDIVAINPPGAARVIISCSRVSAVWPLFGPLAAESLWP